MPGRHAAVSPEKTSSSSEKSPSLAACLSQTESGPDRRRGSGSRAWIAVPRKAGHSSPHQTRPALAECRKLAVATTAVLAAATRSGTRTRTHSTAAPRIGYRGGKSTGTGIGGTRRRTTLLMAALPMRMAVTIDRAAETIVATSSITRALGTRANARGALVPLMDRESITTAAVSSLLINIAAIGATEGMAARRAGIATTATIITAITLVTRREHQPRPRRQLLRREQLPRPRLRQPTPHRPRQATARARARSTAARQRGVPLPCSIRS